MTTGEPRSYSSPLRAEQAAATRDRIIDAAVALLQEGDAGSRSPCRTSPTGRRLGAHRLPRLPHQGRPDRGRHAAPSRSDFWPTAGPLPDARADEADRRASPAVGARPSSSSSRSTAPCSRPWPGARRTGAPATNGWRTSSRSSPTTSPALPADRGPTLHRRRLHLLTSSRSMLLPQGLRRARRRRRDRCVGMGDGWSRLGRDAAGRQEERMDDDRVEGAGRGALGAGDARTCRAASRGCSRSGRPGVPRRVPPATSARYGLPIDHLDDALRQRPLLRPHAAGRRAGAEAGQGRARRRRASCCGSWPACTPSSAGGRRRRGGRSSRSCGTRTACGGSSTTGPRSSPPTGRCRPSRIEQLDDDALVDHLRRAADHMERGIALHMTLIPVQGITVGRLLLACRSWGIDDADDVRAARRQLAGIDGFGRRSGRHRPGVRRRRGRTEDARRRPRRRPRRGDRPRRLPRRPRVARHHAVLATRPGADRAARRPRAGHPGRRDRADRHRHPPTSTPCAPACRMVSGPGSTTSSPTPAPASACATTTWPSTSSGRAASSAGRCSRPAAASPSRACSRTRRTSSPSGRTRSPPPSPATPSPRRGGGGAGRPTAPPPRPTAPHCNSATTRVRRPTPGCSRPPWPRWSRRSCSSSSSEQAMLGEVKAPPAGRATGSASAAARRTPGGRASPPPPRTRSTRLQEGDVLVTTLTTPAFEAVMPIAGAVVTETGGLMGHTAICAASTASPPS